MTSMMPPPYSADPSDEGIPAADPGAGAPRPAEGFGVEGEEPDRAVEGSAGQEQGEGADSGQNSFRTPDPESVGPGTGD